MATGATIFKATLKIADMDRNHYADHALTLARHPSETDERLMVRLLAFALHADASLGFGKGLSNEDEPALWQKDLTGAIDLWIEVGQPEEKALRKACGRARQVVAYSYGGRVADTWWQQNAAALGRLDNLCVRNLPAGTSLALAKLAQRNLTLHCTIQEGRVLLAADAASVEIEPTTLKPAR